jgi:hypothetical protein
VLEDGGREVPELAVVGDVERPERAGGACADRALPDLGGPVADGAADAGREVLGERVAELAEDHVGAERLHSSHPGQSRVTFSAMISA